MILELCCICKEAARAQPPAASSNTLRMCAFSTSSSSCSSDEPESCVLLAATGGLVVLGMSSPGGRRYIGLKYLIRLSYSSGHCRNRLPSPKIDLTVSLSDIKPYTTIHKGRGMTKDLVRLALALPIVEARVIEHSLTRRDNVSETKTPACSPVPSDRSVRKLSRNDICTGPALAGDFQLLHW